MSNENCENKIFNVEPYATYLVGEIPQGIFKASIAPRPIGWVSSVSSTGCHNLAPFSYFNAVCDNPPTIMVSMTDQHTDSGPKDTLQNIEDTHHFVVNIVTKELFEQMNLTSINLSRNIDEFVYAKLDWIDSNLGKARRVKNSPIHLECEYVNSIQLPQGNKDVVNRMIIGTVVAMHINPNFLTKDGKVDYDKLQLIARLGYNDYLVLDTKNTFKSSRPK
jgi:flavin reductase (DIM6/NTAB) family NADH-FMN oxidoreductase RutF